MKTNFWIRELKKKVKKIRKTIKNDSNEEMNNLWRRNRVKHRINQDFLVGTRGICLQGISTLKKKR